MRLNIRSKLVLFIGLPVLLVYAILFWLGVSQVRDHLGDDARDWLLEHANHQAARLALVLYQVPALAEALGDYLLADPDQSQELLYAHLIDGLRRTPIADSAAITFLAPARNAFMRRGEPSAGPVLPPHLRHQGERMPGWQVDAEHLRFHRPIYRRGEPAGVTWVEVKVADLYAELEHRRSAALMLLIRHRDGHLLPPPRLDPAQQALQGRLPQEMPTGTVQTLAPTAAGTAYWVAGVDLPDSPWQLLAVYETATALAPARRQATSVILALLLSLAAIVLIIGLAARWLTQPLQALSTSVKQVTSGNFVVAPEVTSNDELGDLARTITRMARHIQDREQQLRSSRQVLEQRVAERTSALVATNTLLTRQVEETRKTEEALRQASEQALQASRTKSEFLSNMSHELRTPLHGVLGYAQILLRDPSTSSGQRDSLEAIQRSGQHLLTLINQILDLTKIEAGQMPVARQATDPSRLIADVQLIVAQRVANKGLELRLELDPGLPRTILTDAVKLKQILLNLLGNAVKFTTQGQIRLSVQTVEDRLQFEVADTGVGIPADRLDGIFDAFNQVGGSQAVDGTGLGLAITQRLINLLGGAPLRVESTPGQGSLFRFWVPFQAVDDEDQVAREVETADPDRRQGDRVEARPPAPQATSIWPAALAEATGRTIATAVDQGDVARLFDLADELAADPSAPRTEVENLALMARMFDFEGLRALSKRLQAHA